MIYWYLAAPLSSPLLTVLRLGGDLRAVALGAALAPLAALGGDGRVGLQLLAVPGPSRGRRRGGRAALRQGAQLRVRAPVPHAVGLRAVRVRRVVRAVCVRQARVWVVVLLGSVAHLLAAGLRPTRLGGVDGRRPGNRLSCGERGRGRGGAEESRRVRVQIVKDDGGEHGWFSCSSREVILSKH